MIELKKMEKGQKISVLLFDICLVILMIQKMTEWEPDGWLSLCTDYV